MIEYSGFLRSTSEQTVIYRYLEMLAERTADLEQRVGLGELQTLQTEVQQLQLKVAQLESPTMEALLVYLPTFFLSFWATVSPTALATIVGTLRIPEVPRNTPPPDSATVLVMKRQYLQLEESDKARIRHFCRQLQKSYQLQFHPQVRTLFAE